MLKQVCVASKPAPVAGMKTQQVAVSAGSNPVASNAIQVKPYVAGAGRGLDWSRSGELVIGMVGVGRREVLTLADGRRYEECGGDFWGAVGG